MPNHGKARAILHGIEDCIFHLIGYTNACHAMVVPSDLVQITERLPTEVELNHA